MYIEELTKNYFSNFPKFDLITRKNIIFPNNIFIETMEPQFLELWNTFKNEMTVVSVMSKT